MYATWLSECLVLLNSNSIKLLDEFGAKSGHLVLYSLVTDFEYHHELNKFTRYCTAGSRGVSQSNGTLLKTAIMSDAAKNVKIPLKDLGNILNLLTSANKLSEENIYSLKEASLTEWPMYFKQFAAEEMIQDNYTIESAHKDIHSRHKELDNNLTEVKGLANFCKPRYCDVDLPINNKQMVTGVIAYLNSQKVAKQVWVVPASHGKSRIQSILAVLATMQTKQKVRIVFADESIKKRDKKLNEKILDFLEKVGYKWGDRVSFEVGVNPENKWNSGYVFIDELDVVMFEDLEKYHKATKHANLKVIGLTATAFDGHEQGSELEALQKLGYQIYHNCSNPVDFKPIVHEHKSLITKQEYADYIHLKAKEQPVLIYATGLQAKELLEICYVEPVTEATDPE